MFFTVLMVFASYAYSENAGITIGKQYSNAEINNLMPYLDLFAKVELADRVLWVYKLNDSNKLDDNKLCVLSDVSGKLFDAYGVRFLDSNSWYSVVTETNCVVQIKLNADPIHNLLSVASEFDKIIFLPIEHNFVADVCVSNGKIYYSTEFSNGTIYCIDIVTGQTFNFVGYYPNVDLFEFVDGKNKIIVFDYEAKQYILQDNQIVLATKQYDILRNKKNLGDYKITR